MITTNSTIEVRCDRCPTVRRFENLSLERVKRNLEVNGWQVHGHIILCPDHLWESKLDAPIQGLEDASKLLETLVSIPASGWVSNAVQTLSILMHDLRQRVRKLEHGFVIKHEDGRMFVKPAPAPEPASVVDAEYNDPLADGTSI